MSNSLSTVYSARPDATPKAECSALAAVYRLVIDRAKKNAAGMTSTNGDDAKGSGTEHVRATTSIPNRP